MNIIPAPMRQLKTWSMMLTIADGIFNAGVGMAHALSDANVMSVQTFATVNSVLAAGIVAVRFIQQNIPVSTEDKKDIIAAAAAQPMQSGHENVKTTIDGAPTLAVPTV